MNPRIGRRALLGGMAAALAPASVRASAALPPHPPPPARPGSRLDRLALTTPARLELTVPAAGESWSGWFHGAGGRGYDPAALDSLDGLLRDWRENVRARLCVRLFWALAAAGTEARRRGGSGEAVILSGYRTPRTNASIPGAARNSMHLYGRALDIRVRGLTVPDLSAFMRSLEVGGVGEYRTAAFTHIDSGRLRRWDEN